MITYARPIQVDMSTHQRGEEHTRNISADKVLTSCEGTERPLRSMFRTGVFIAAAFTFILLSVVLSDGRARMKQKDEQLSQVDDIRDVFPSLLDVLEGRKIIGPVSWLLDFAVVGSAKCGTGFLRHYLGESNETFVPHYEVCKLSKGRPDEIVKLFYNESFYSSSSKAAGEELHRIKHGLKCPKDLTTELGLRNYAEYFPGTYFIVTTRHPVLWFQSFYNYRSYGMYPDRMPHPEELVGPCVDGSPYVCDRKCGKENYKNNVCTDRAKFHHQLSRLGKTPMATDEELRLLHHDMKIVPFKGRIFLLELGQLFPGSDASKYVSRDLSNFLNLKHELAELTISDRVQYPEEARQHYFIDICDDEYRGLRSSLVEIGREAAEWIVDYFLGSPHVVVSYRTEFLRLVDLWGHDPCEDKKQMRILAKQQSLFED